MKTNKNMIHILLLTALNCSGCGRKFGKNEKTVSYDFERFYCFRCDDER